MMLESCGFVINQLWNSNWGSCMQYNENAIFYNIQFLMEVFYLFGNISIGVANYTINNPQVNFLQDYIKYRPHLTEIINQIPIYVIKQASLGLEGAYQTAYRLLEYNDYLKEI
ncbi:unnamed protein product [Paramecium pentaurelia]|uniref:Uncharacterized protein n=1 Tax=Paramecium pentaurelia TaxID=43138 RepID=A0A8S1VID6_9CILI|nr:unnamed protein product [Paramecium pentaurelia]